VAKSFVTRNRSRRATDNHIELSLEEIEKLRALLPPTVANTLDKSVLLRQERPSGMVPISTLARILDALPAPLKDHTLWSILRAAVGN